MKTSQRASNPPSPCMTLKGMHAGVGIGSGNETTCSLYAHGCLVSVHRDVVLVDTTFVLSIPMQSTFVLVLANADTKTLPLLKSITLANKPYIFLWRSSNVFTLAGL